MNPSFLYRRARIVSAIRSFFDGRDYLEVATPARIPAPAPEVHIDPVPSGAWCLQTSPRIVHETIAVRRSAENLPGLPLLPGRRAGDRHLSEFTMLEWYTAGHTYLDMMAQTEELIRALADALPDDMGKLGEPGGFAGLEGRIIHRKLDGKRRTVDLSGKFDRITVEEAFGWWASMSAWEALEAGKFDECMAFEIEPHLGMERPAFLVDYPAPLGALARKRPDNPNLAERFELYIAGLELCNGFGELTDPAEQRSRFEADQEAIKKAGKSVYPMPELFLSDLEHMPDAAGNALGVDRLVMLLTGAERIIDVACFAPEALG